MVVVPVDNTYGTAKSMRCIKYIQRHLKAMDAGKLVDQYGNDAPCFLIWLGFI